MQKLFRILAVFLLGGGLAFSVGPANSFAQRTPSRTDIELLAPFPGQSSVIETKNKGAIEILGEYVSQIFLFGMALIAIFAVIMIMVSGYQYMFAGGESGNLESAKNRITQALLGLALVFLSALLLSIINPNFYKL